MRPLRKPIHTALAGAAVLSLALVGCSSGGDKATEDGEAAATDSTDTSTEDAEFVFLHRMPNREGAKTVDELIEEFNDSHPGITVVGETMQGSAPESYPKIRSIVEAGQDVPCVAQLGSERLPDMLDTLEDVTEYVTLYQDNFLPAFYDKGRVGDSWYGLPMGASPIVLYYRADLFEEYGLELPTTWDEYMEQAAVVKELAGDGVYMGSFLTDEPMWLSALTTSEGADWFGFDPADQAWSVDIESPDTSKVAALWQELIDDGDVIATPRWGDDYVRFLSDGTLVTHIGAPWESTMFMNEVPDAAGMWKVAQIPHIDASGTLVGQNGGSVAAVLKGCEYPAQATEFINWWSTNVEGLTGLGLLPASKVESIPTPEDLKEYFSGQDIYEEYVKANDNAPVVTWAPMISDVISAISDQQAQVLSGASVEEIFVVGQQKAVETLESAGATVK